MKIKMLKKMFKYINRELFDDMLDMPLFYLYTEKEMKKVYKFEFEGLCVPIGDNYLLGIHKDLTKQNTFDTIVHEMIHMELMNSDSYSGHGKPFLKLCEKGIDTFYHNML